MSTTTTVTAICDCCGYTITDPDLGDFIQVTQGAQMLLLCSAKGCANGLLTQLAALVTTKSVAHQALTVLGVIAAHP